MGKKQSFLHLLPFPKFRETVAYAQSVTTENNNITTKKTEVLEETKKSQTERKNSEVEQVVSNTKTQKIKEQKADNESAAKTKTTPSKPIYDSGSDSDASTNKTSASSLKRSRTAFLTLPFPKIRKVLAADAKLQPLQKEEDESSSSESEDEEAQETVESRIMTRKRTAKAKKTKKNSDDSSDDEEEEGSSEYEEESSSEMEEEGSASSDGDEYVDKKPKRGSTKKKEPKSFPLVSDSAVRECQRSSLYIEITQSPEGKEGASLMPFQLEGLNWIRKNFYAKRNSMLADEMGLGKTIQAASFLQCLKTECNIFGPFLIVVPVSVLDNWERELEKWTDFKVVKLFGSKPECSEIFKSNGINVLAHGRGKATTISFNCILTSYEKLRDFPAVTRVPYKWVVFDEAHKLKTRSTKIRKVAEKLKTCGMLLLTGTPLQNNVLEFVDLMSLISNDFKEMDREKLEERNAEQLEELKVKMKPYLLQRKKEQVLKLPPKKEIHVDVALTKAQKTLYRAIYEKNRDVLMRKIAKSVSLLDIALLLRQCCNHPYLIRGVEDSLKADGMTEEEEEELIVTASSKMIVLDKLIKKAIESNEKMLIFSQMLDMLDILEDYLDYREIKFLRIDGSTQARSRQGLIDKFNNPDSEYKVFLLSTKAGGIGINLTSATQVVIFDSDYNPFNDVQAVSRAHRIGQTKDVKIYRLLTKHTIEKYIMTIAGKKLGMEKVMMESKKEGLETEEVDEMLKYGYYHQLEKGKESAEQDLLSQDIDTILKSAEVVTIESSNDDIGSSFSKVSISTDKDDTSIDDVDFWQKIFPDYIDLSEVERRIREYRPFSSPEEKKQFFSRLTGLVNDYTAMNDTSNKKDKDPLSVQSESSTYTVLQRRAKLHSLLRDFLAKADLLGFKKKEVAIVNTWIASLEQRTLRGGRKRRNHSEMVTHSQMANSDDDDDAYVSEGEGQEDEKDEEYIMSQLVEEKEVVEQPIITPPVTRKKTKNSKKKGKELEPKPAPAIAPLPFPFQFVQHIPQTDAGASSNSKSKKKGTLQQVAPPMDLMMGVMRNLTPARNMQQAPLPPPPQPMTMPQQPVAPSRRRSVPLQQLSVPSSSSSSSPRQEKPPVVPPITPPAPAAPKSTTGPSSGSPRTSEKCYSTYVRSKPTKNSISDVMNYARLTEMGRMTEFITNVDLQDVLEKLRKAHVPNSDIPPRPLLFESGKASFLTEYINIGQQPPKPDPKPTQPPVPTPAPAPQPVSSAFRPAVPQNRQSSNTSRTTAPPVQIPVPVPVAVPAPVRPFGIYMAPVVPQGFPIQFMPPFTPPSAPNASVSSKYIRQSPRK